MKPCMERIYNGILKENPALVLMLGGVQSGDFASSESDSRRGPASGLYCNCSFSGYGGGAFDRGLCSSPLQCSWNLYSSDCGELYYSGEGGGIRF